MFEQQGNQIRYFLISHCVLQNRKNHIKNGLGNPFRKEESANDEKSIVG